MRSQVFEWLFLEIFIQPKTWRRIFKSCWCFQISSSSFPSFSPSQNKNSPSRFYFLRRRIFSTSENSCHSLHEYCNLLIFKLSPCNDKQKCHVTDVTFAIEWHQWHAKNKHITRGSVDIQRFMTSVQWVQWDWESKWNDIGLYLHLSPYHLHRFTCESWILIHCFSYIIGYSREMEIRGIVHFRTHQVPDFVQSVRYRTRVLKKYLPK